MSNEELNTALYQKMFAEQDKFRDWLLSQSPEEILKHTYEYTVREDILLSLEYHDLTDAQANALLESPDTMSDLFKNFESMETGYMDTVWESVTDRANEAVKMKQEQNLATVYPHSAAYAQEHGEVDAYRASYMANLACKEAIEKAIHDHYHNNSLGSDAIKDVLAQFGMERTQYVLANTIRSKDEDGRISSDNKTWAKSIPVLEDTDAWSKNRNAYLVVDGVNPGLTDIFTRLVRKAAQEQVKEKISVLGKLQHQPVAPKSTVSKKREPER